VSRLTNAWRAMEPEQRLAAVASVALLLTMFFPWYGLQSLNRKTGAISSHTINAFGDVSFVEAAVFLVAAAILAMLLARVEGRNFHLPGGDGTIVMVAGGWAALLIFYRVFSRPTGNGYPVGIEWGFFLAFVAAGALTYAGWRMRAVERPEPPARAPRERPRPPSRGEQGPSEEGRRSHGNGPRATAREPTGAADAGRSAQTDPTALVPSSPRTHSKDTAPEPAERPSRAARPRYPPAPPGAPQAPQEAEQLSFEDSPRRSE
jgi:hypothetical protein